MRKAIQMLHSDDSRDLFSKTMKRHEGQVLLQLKVRMLHAPRRRAFVSVFWLM